MRKMIVATVAIIIMSGESHESSSTKYLCAEDGLIYVKMFRPDMSKLDTISTLSEYSISGISLKRKK